MEERKGVIQIVLYMSMFANMKDVMLSTQAKLQKIFSQEIVNMHTIILVETKAQLR